MDNDPLSVSESSVGSRFISEKQLDSAKAARDAQWKAAYERLGQEPPPRQEPEVYDGRSLAEKLAANKAAKIEEREERAKLGNQFRALEEDEVVFLDSITDERNKEERKRRREDDDEVEGFKAAIAARNKLGDEPPQTASTSPSTEQSNSLVKPRTTPLSIKKKPGLKGVVVKKKKSDKVEPSSKSSPVQTGEASQKRQKVAEDVKESPET